MLEFDTPFRAKARRLPAPNAPNFDPALWSSLLKTENPDGNDLALAVTAAWIAGQAASFRDHVSSSNLPQLDARTATLLAVATLNREHSVISTKLLKVQNTAAIENSPISTDQLANLPIKAPNGLFEVDANSRLDAATDAVDSWLFEATGYSDQMSMPADLRRSAAASVRRFSMQRGHFDLWQQALWENWRLVNRAGRNIFAPVDSNLAALREAWLLRKQSNFMEHAWLDMSVWPEAPQEMRRARQLPLTVIRIEERKGKRRQFIVARPPIARMSAYAIANAGLEGSYLQPFLTRSFTIYPDLTCQLLLKAWFVLNDMAHALSEARPRATFNDIANVRRWALVVNRDEVIEALCRTLSISEKVAATVVEFLSWTKGTYKGLWGAPLVPLPGQPTQLAVAASILSTANVVRTVEIWMTKGGLADNVTQGSRGKLFEAELRNEVRAALKSNPILLASACAEHAIKKGPHFQEEIDLLIRFESLLLVGEVKCFMFPADSRERYNYLKNLKAACAQASRKAKVIAGRLDVAAKALGTPDLLTAQLKVVPIVVINQGFGVSLIEDDCVVTDAKFLKIYLAGGTYVSEGAANHVDGGWADATNLMYKNADEAVAKFSSTMRKPPPLDRFQRLLQWSTFNFPTASGEHLLIAQTEMGSLPTETQSLYEVLSAVVDT